jgi:hypothetical protein
VSGFDKNGESMIYLRIMPELRRSAYYVLASGVPLALVAYCVARFAQGRSIASAACVSGILFLLCMTMIVPLRWALRIDDHGIARRLLFRWDLWMWADFSSGGIAKRHRYTLTDPARPWWRRKLTLDYMAEKDIAFTLGLINAHYKLPVAPPLPDDLTVRYAFRRSARLDAKGIHLQGPNEGRTYLWNEVRRVHITRMDPVRRDFWRLELVLPDREILLTVTKQNGCVCNSWSGATAETINDALVRFVSPERIDVDILGEQPARRIDIEKQLAKIRKNDRELRQCLWVLWPLAVGCFIWMGVERSAVGAVIMAGLFFMNTVPLMYFARRESQSHRRKLEQQLATFDRNDSTT